MTIYVVSDRKHVRIAIYNLLGISPDPETGTRVIHKMTESDLSRATAEDTFAGNLPLEWLARIQERGAKTLVFEADGLDDASFDPTGPGRILDAVDKTGRLVAYDVTREPDAPAEPDSGSAPCSRSRRSGNAWLSAPPGVDSLDKFQNTVVVYRIDVVLYLDDGRLPLRFPLFRAFVLEPECFEPEVIRRAAGLTPDSQMRNRIGVGGSIRFEVDRHQAAQYAMKNNR